MAAVPSVGDILMHSQLAWRIGRAFAAGRKDAPPEFLEVETELNGLAKALKLLAETLFADDKSLLKQAEIQTTDGLASILTACQRTVKDLDVLIEGYQVIKKIRTAGGFAIERSWSELALTSYKTMAWTAESGTIQHLQRLLQIHTTVVLLVMQALRRSKSLARLESMVPPVAEKLGHIHQRTGSIDGNLEALHQLVFTIAKDNLELPSNKGPDHRPTTSLRLDASSHGSLKAELGLDRDYFAPQSTVLRSPPPQVPLPRTPDRDVPVAISSMTPVAPPASRTRKRISEFSCSGSTIRYSSSASSDAGSIVEWPSSAMQDLDRRSHISHQSSVKRASKLPVTPELREIRSRPDSGVLSALPPPALEMGDLKITKAASLSTLSTLPPAKQEHVKLHRSATTASQEAIFEKLAFRNSAILCDVRGALVEYTQKSSSDADCNDVGLVPICTHCRVLVVRKRDSSSDKSSSRMLTSIWVFSDDNTIRLQLTLSEGELYVPYSSYFNPCKISLTVPCSLVFHDVQYGNRPLQTAKTSWINYVFEDMKGATSFQNELMGRTLLATFPTAQTLRSHEGFAGAFSYAEQMCGMENLRIWEDDETLAVIAMTHFSAQFRQGYLAFYLNSSEHPIRIKDEGGREVKIKGLRIPMEGDGARKARKDSAVAGVHGRKEAETKKFITGCKVEFESEDDKRRFLGLVWEVQAEPRELPELLGVN